MSGQTVATAVAFLVLAAAALGALHQLWLRGVKPVFIGVVRAYRIGARLLEVGTEWPAVETAVANLVEQLGKLAGEIGHLREEHRAAATAAARAQGALEERLGKAVTDINGVWSFARALEQRLAHHEGSPHAAT